MTRMKGAVELYAGLGFEEIDPYYFHPADDVIYMKKTLDPN